MLLNFDVESTNSLFLIEKHFCWSHKIKQIKCDIYFRVIFRFDAGTVLILLENIIFIRQKPILSNTCLHICCWIFENNTYFTMPSEVTQFIQ
jgi:hypothetical protein